MSGPDQPPGDFGLPLDDLVALGRITRPHGVSGAVRMLPYYDPPEELQKLRGDRVVLFRKTDDLGPGINLPLPCSAPHVVHIADFFVHRQFVILQFVEIQGIVDAEALRGAEVLVAPDVLWVPEEGTYFVHELLGFELVDSGADRVVGKVVGIEPGAAHDFIRVRSDLREFLVPFSKAVVNAVCVSERRILASLPQGLDEV